MRPKTIVFDLDGTLVDSLPDISNSFRYGFAKLGLPVPDATAVRAEIGKPLEEMYASFAPAEQVAALCACYREHYPQHFTDQTRPYPGVLELLAQLRQAGFKTAVATTKQSFMATRLLTALGLVALIDHIQGTDGFPHKPAPDVILRALAAVGGDGLWMVGDTVSDIAAGKAAGLKTYAVSWGTHDAATLASAHPDVLATTLTPLLELTALSQK
ncbi:MAG: HAD-IA family hydrolase [Truepera sp.]|nr:HAD-IA family hydrolase [Truepera sp.]MBS3968022.1 HAD-IA family hydrolase [Truepera sp.]